MKYRIIKRARVHSKPSKDSSTIIEAEPGTIINGNTVDDFVEYEALRVFGKPMIGYIQLKYLEEIKTSKCSKKDEV